MQSQARLYDPDEYKNLVRLLTTTNTIYLSICVCGCVCVSLSLSLSVHSNVKETYETFDHLKQTLQPFIYIYHLSSSHILSLTIFYFSGLVG